MVGGLGLALGLIGPALATTQAGPLLVTDDADAYAIEGSTASRSNASAVFGYGASTRATGIDGVTGFVRSIYSVGVYGYSAMGNAIYGESGSRYLATIYGVNDSPVGGTALYGRGMGLGVLGLSTASSGVVGITETARGGDGHLAGVLGQDNSTAGSHDGVAGQSNTGTGVYGSGVQGVYGTTNDPAGYGVDAINAGGGTALYGSAVGKGIAGWFSSASEALYAQSPGGSADLGLSSGEGGIFFGKSGNANHPALAVVASSGTDAVGTYNGSHAETFIVQAGTQNHSGYADAGGSDVQVSGDLYVQGRVYSECSRGGSFPAVVAASEAGCAGPQDTKVRAHSTSGVDVTAYAPHQSVPTMEDFGEAQLVDGRAEVPLERTFASTIDASRSYLVFLTPEGDCHGLYIAAKSSSGFTVRELMSGRSTLTFQYRIVAHPYADTATRLPAAVRPPSAAVTMQHDPFAALGTRRPSPLLQQGPVTTGVLPEQLRSPAVALKLQR